MHPFSGQGSAVEDMEQRIRSIIEHLKALDPEKAEQVLREIEAKLAELASQK